MASGAIGLSVAPGRSMVALANLHMKFVDAALRCWQWFIDHEDLGIVATERP